jgi:molybdopterin converting factor small subunit
MVIYKQKAQGSWHKVRGRMSEKYKMPLIGGSELWNDIMLHAFVNRQIAGFDQILKDNDVINLHIPVSGG